MRILSRYVLREFLVPVAYCFLAFASLYLVIDLFNEFDEIIPNKPPFSLILTYLGGALAEVIHVILPASIFLGGLYAMWQLSRHSEITAMRASGIGFVSITAPMLAAAFFFAAITFLNSEFYAPKATVRAHQIKDNKFKVLESSGKFQNVPYNNSSAKRDWLITIFDANGEMHDVTITWTDDAGRKTQVFKAQTGRYIEGVWIFENTKLTRFGASTDSFQMADYVQTRQLAPMPELTETPRDFMLSIQQDSLLDDSETLSIRDMRRYLANRPNIEPEQLRRWRYNIANRYSAPFACVVITLFAIPFGVATGRQSVFIGVLSAILLYLIFYVLTISCGALAQSGALPVHVGILLPNAIFLAAGICLFHRNR